MHDLGLALVALTLLLEILAPVFIRPAPPPEPAPVFCIEEVVISEGEVGP